GLAEAQLDARQHQLGVGEVGAHLQGVEAELLSRLEVAARLEQLALAEVAVLVEALRVGRSEEEQHHDQHARWQRTVPPAPGFPRVLEHATPSGTRLCGDSSSYHEPHICR